MLCFCQVGQAGADEYNLQVSGVKCQVLSKALHKSVPGLRYVGVEALAGFTGIPG